MTRQEAKERLQKLNDLKLPFGFGSILYHKNRDLYDYVLEQTHFLDNYKKVTINERIYCILHDLKDRPLCETCHKKKVARFFPDADVTKSHYGKFCSIRCSALSPEIQSKTEATKMERYGDAHFTNREKSMATKIKRYGDPYYTNREKAMATMDERYHGDYSEIIEKRKETIDKKLEEDPDMWKKREEKIAKTKLELHGDSKYNNREKFKETIASFSPERKEEINQKRANTNIEKYGCKTPLENIEVLKYAHDKYEAKTGFRTPRDKGAPGYLKALEVKRERYGNPHYSNRDKISETTRKNFYNDVILKLTTVEPLFSLEEYVAIENSTGAFFNWRCKKCGTEFSARMSHNVEHRFVRCPTCFPLEYGTSSQIEKELVDYIKTFYNGVVSENNRQLIYPLEVDVYLPEIKLAIEFNGSYWHSDLFKDDPFYHLNKTEQCEKNGVKLIHIFESDYVANSEIVKHFLKEEILFRTNSGYSEPLQQFSIKSFDRKNAKILLKEACGCRLSNVSANDIIVVVTKDDGSIIGFAKFSKDNNIGKLIPTFFKKYSNEIEIVIRIAKHLKESNNLVSMEVRLDRCKHSLLELESDVEFSISKPKKHFVRTVKNGVNSYIYDAGLIEILVL